MGSRHGSQVGSQLHQAAERMGVPCAQIDTNEAYQGWGVARRILWGLGRRPLRLGKFSRKVQACAFHSGTRILLTTGISPIHARSLNQIKKEGAKIINYSTDDPWNPAQQAGWFFKALMEYDQVFSTRKANLTEFDNLGVKAEYLPFGYDPGLYFAPWEKRSHPGGNLKRGEGAGDRGGEEEKVFLAGGGDEDRYPLVKALHEAGIQMSLWGGYWERAGLKSQGFLDAAGIRREAAQCMVSMILVRRANRDGSAMRSFEIPACGGCCVAEDTEEHREMFGPDGEAVLYFRTPEELVRRVKEAFADPGLRQRLRKNAHQAITAKPNTYLDRLKAILERVG